VFIIWVFLCDVYGFGEIERVKCGIDVDEVCHKHIPARYGIIVLFEVAVQDGEISLYSQLLPELRILHELSIARALQ
jgi:hypothetical protein